MADSVQQLIQNLAPMSANNGNPNTAYNNSPVPVMDAFGNWALPATSPAAVATFQRNTNAPWAQVGTGNTGLNLPVFPTLPPLTSTPFTPTVPSNGGNTPPSAPSTGGTINPYTPPTQVGQPSASTGGQTGNQTLPGNFLNNMPPIGSFQGNISTGGTGTGTLPDWQQLVDVAGDALGLPGNWYLSNTGQWDISNILEGLGDYATGGLVSPALDLLTKLYTDPQTGMFKDTAPNWLMDRTLDNVQNSATGLLNEWTKATDQRTQGLIAQEAESIINKYGMTNAPAPTTAGQALAAGWSAVDAARVFGPQAVQSAISANPYSVDVGTRLAAGVGKGGAGVITGDAARSMFDAMKLSQLGVKQTGGDIYGRTYER